MPHAGSRSRDLVPSHLHVWCFFPHKIWTNSLNTALAQQSVSSSQATFHARTHYNRQDHRKIHLRKPRNPFCCLLFWGLFTYHMIDLNRWPRVTLVNRAGRRSHWKTAPNLRKSPEVNGVASHCVGVFGTIILNHSHFSKTRETALPSPKIPKGKWAIPCKWLLNGNHDPIGIRCAQWSGQTQ